MKRLTSLRAILILVLSFSMFQSCSDKLNKSLSPTAPALSKKADSTSARGKTVSGIQPLVPYFNEGARYIRSFWLFNKYLPEDSAKGRYLVLVGAPPNGDYASMYNNYCFRRAVEGADQIPALTSAGFKLSEILVQIGWHTNNPWPQYNEYIMYDNWESVVSEYRGSVLGYWMDEPSGFLQGQDVGLIRQTINQNGGFLWIEDYDTGPIPSIYPPHTYHLADVPMLDNGQFLWNNGNTSKWISGNNSLGIGPYVQDNYDEFQNWFGNQFDGIECQAMDNSGALRNDATMIDWLKNHPSVDNFALYMNGDYPSGIAPSIGNFESDAAGAGFLGTENELYNYIYVCQQNAVLFTPPGPAGSYYGLWNGSGYTGPVDPSTQGAVLCWSLSSRTPTGQFQDIY